MLVVLHRICCRRNRLLPLVRVARSTGFIQAIATLCTDEELPAMMKEAEERQTQWKRGFDFLGAFAKSF